MDRNAEIETEREVLKRIVATLFSFAVLAERASVRCYPVRCLVLWILRRAEAVARDWIIADGSDDMQSNAPMVVLHRNSQAEAVYLAKSFRALAHLLRRELRLEERLARRLLRGETNHSTGDTPRLRLLEPVSFSRFARAMRDTLHCLRSLGLEPALRPDTS